MGLTAHDISSVHRLAQLAANPDGASREEIYLAVTSLYRVEDTHLTPRERALIHDILRTLAKDVEMSIRISLAQKLADDPSAPHGLITMLADDRIEVARPVILRSPLLSEQDLLHIAVACSPYHQMALAERPNLSEQITAQLVGNTHECVLMALIRNVTARISVSDFMTLAEASRRISALQEPLAQRPDLPTDVGMRMCAFVSETLKAFILKNYSVRLEKLQTSLEVTRQEMLKPRDEAKPQKEEPGNNARKLIEKLYLAGQLKAGFLVRILQQGNIELFELGLARLLNISIASARQILYELGPEMVALACRATGIDRSVFGTIYTLSHRARALPATLTQNETARVANAFMTNTRTEALRRLQSL